MTQRDSLNTPTLEIPSPAVELAEMDASNLVDAYADDLMGDLFGDVDRILAGETELSNDEAEPEPQADTAFTYAHESLSGAIVPLGAGLKLATPTLDLSTLVAPSTATPATATSRRWFGRSFDRFFLGAACMSLVFTLLLWLVDSQYRTRQEVAIAPEPAPTAAELQAEADRQYLEYLERSLQVLDQQSGEAVATAPAQPPSLPTLALSPTSGAPGTLPPLPGSLAASPRPSVVERVYVPVYQPPQALAPTVTPVAPTPAPTAPAAPAAPTRLPQPSPTAAAPVVTHLLVGILELGDRSAALFEIDGAPQRVYIGQPIGSSGWTLVSVANQEAVIRRNGDVRSVIVGQKF
ncbi:MAG: hypothetical protein ACTS3T_07115 [Almyronema sp.]